MNRGLSYETLLLALALAVAGTQASAHPGLHHDIEIVSAKLSQDTQNVDLLIKRGRLYRLDEKPLLSLISLERAYGLDANAERMNLELGLTLAALERYKQAEEHLNRYIARGDALPAAHAARGRIRARDGRLELAIDDFSAALLRDCDIDDYLTRGRLQEALGRFDDAAAGYREGLRRTRGAVTLRLALIRAEVARERYDAALALIDEVAPKARVKTHWYLRRARVLDAAGSPERASLERQRALVEADRALARRATAINLVARARVFVEMDQLAAARNDLCAAIRKAPGFTEAQVLLSDMGGRCDDTVGDSDEGPIGVGESVHRVCMHARARRHHAHVPTGCKRLLRNG